MAILDGLGSDNSALTAATRPAAPSWAAAGPVSGSSADRLASAKKAGQDFESFFVTSMLESMMAGIKTDKLFGGGQGEAMYRSMLNQEYGKAIARSGSLGIADMVQREILRMQEAARS